MPDLPAMPELERQVMEQVWLQGEATVRSVMDVLNEDATHPERAYPTIATILLRLEAKGLLARRRHKRADVFTPLITREQYRAARADAEVSRVLADYGELALAQFARRMEALDPERREQLRRLAEE